jgi:Ca2+-binding EF-hand superfamily protein
LQKLSQVGTSLAPFEDLNSDYDGLQPLCSGQDFDPYIKYGRDNQLFVKRDALNNLSKITRYSEQEIKNLMTMYAAYAVPQRGLNMRRFDYFWTQVTNIQHHPFLIDIFIFFDRETNDRVIDFFELVVGMDIVERGSFDEKCKYCFAMYDVLEQNYLDLYSLREVMKRTFTQHIVNLEQAMQEIRSAVVREQDIHGLEIQLNYNKFYDKNNPDQISMDMSRFDGYINWNMLVKNTKAITLLK